MSIVIIMIVWQWSRDPLLRHLVLKCLIFRLLNFNFFIYLILQISTLINLKIFKQDSNEFFFNLIGDKDIITTIQKYFHIHI